MSLDLDRSVLWGLGWLFVAALTVWLGLAYALAAMAPKHEPEPALRPWGTIVYGAAHDCYEACGGRVAHVQYDINGVSCTCDTSDR